MRQALALCATIAVLSVGLAACGGDDTTDLPGTSGVEQGTSSFLSESSSQ